MVAIINQKLLYSYEKGKFLRFIFICYHWMRNEMSTEVESLRVAGCCQTVRPIPPIPVTDNEGRRFRPTAICKDEREGEYSYSWDH